MPMKTSRLGKVSARTSQAAPLLDDPPVGHLQAVVLKQLDVLGRNAYGFKVIEEITLVTGVWIDASQVYAAIRKLEGKGFIELSERRRSADGGPPLKVFKLTASGRAALKAVSAHHTALAEFLS